MFAHNRSGKGDASAQSDSQEGSTGLMSTNALFLVLL